MPARHGLVRIPPAAQAPISAALGAHEAGYRVLGLHAVNRSQHLSATFSLAGAEVSAGKTRVTLALRAYGRGGALAAVGSAVPKAAANRVTYAHPGLTEWYANGPAGLEQGFEITRRASGRGPLTLSIALSGNAVARLGRGGVELGGPGASLRYGGLRVSDAHGRILRSWLQLEARHLLIRVDDRGAAYPLRVDPTVQEATLTAAGGSESADFGRAVAISGDTIVVGAPSQGSGSGAAYVFTKPASGWADATQSAELLAADEASGGYENGFGSTVAVSGNTIVVGAPGHSFGGRVTTGAAYVFTEPASGWAGKLTQSAELTVPPSGRTGGDGGIFEDRLGEAVAVSGGTVVVGAPEHETPLHNGSGPPFHEGPTVRGVAYVFTEPSSGWGRGPVPMATLTAPPNAGLGRAVAISGQTIAVGDPNVDGRGAAFIFNMPAAGWSGTLTPSAELTASDAAEHDGLGRAVAMSEGTIAVGAPGHGVRGSNRKGAIYLFAVPPSGWTGTLMQSAELTAPGTVFPSLELGDSVAISGNTVVGLANGLATYAFTMPPSGWAEGLPQTAVLATADAPLESVNGVAISGNTIVAGAEREEINGKPGAGAAQIFTMPASGWQSTIVPPTVAGLRQSARRWREGRRLPRISARGGMSDGRRPLPVGTTFSLSLNEEGEVSLTLMRRVKGRLVGGTCVARTRKNARHRGCWRTATQGVLSFWGHRGRNRVRFEGRLTRRRRLAPGRYTLAVRAVNRVGEPSGQSRLSFTIER